MCDIDVFNNSATVLNNKVPNKIISWITVLIILLILFILFSFISFNIYKTSLGYVEGGYVKIYNYDSTIDLKDKLYIKDKKYDYSIISINNEEVTLNIELDKSLNIEGNILVINFLRYRTNIFNIIKNKWKDVFYSDKIK